MIKKFKLDFFNIYSTINSFLFLQKEPMFMKKYHINNVIISLINKIYLIKYNFTKNLSATVYYFSITLH